MFLTSRRRSSASATCARFPHWSAFLRISGSPLKRESRDLICSMYVTVHANYQQRVRHKPTTLAVIVGVELCGVTLIPCLFQLRPMLTQRGDLSSSTGTLRWRLPLSEYLRPFFLTYVARYSYLFKWNWI